MFLPDKLISNEKRRWNRGSIKFGSHGFSKTIV